VFEIAIILLFVEFEASVLEIGLCFHMVELITNYFVEVFCKIGFYLKVNSFNLIHIKP